MQKAKKKICHRGLLKIEPDKKLAFGHLKIIFPFEKYPKNIRIFCSFIVNKK